MSLYGALMIGVSALDAFSNSLSMTSSNIANVNTVGYKTGQTQFSTLLADSMGEGDASSAGVISSTAQNIAQQGLLTSASSPTDMAISGNGFFMVSPNPNSASSNTHTGANGVFYTRAGDFQPDADGNLENSSGYYLMGYALNSSGDVAPGTQLGAINVTNLTGKAEPTTTMTLQANLQSSTDVYDGSVTPYTPGALTDGTIAPNFTRTINIYDSQGGSQPVTISFLKTGANQWDYEVSYSGDSSNVNSGLTPSNMLYHGTMTFNTDGSLANADSNVSPASGSISVPMAWTSTSGLAAQTISIDMGTVGASNGMTQYDSSSALVNASVDGALFGTLSGVSVDTSGIVTASFSNGLTQKIYQVPLATFSNPDGLAEVSGNAFAQTMRSGSAVIRSAGDGGAGKIQGTALEGSTVDLATEFTNLITTQRAYTASTRVITTASDMLQDLTQMH